MNEREFASKIKQDLNYGTGHLQTQITARLRDARERALDVFAAQTVNASAYAFAGNAAHGHHHTASRKLLMFALIPLLLIGVMYWQQLEINHEDNIDAALLSSEIPLNAFVDKNFQPWLDLPSQR